MYDTFTGAPLRTRTSTRKSDRLTVRLNETMARKLRAAASGDGKTLSEWMRTALLDAAGEPRQESGDDQPYPGTATRIGE